MRTVRWLTSGLALVALIPSLGAALVLGCEGRCDVVRHDSRWEHRGSARRC